MVGSPLGKREAEQSPPLQHRVCLMPSPLLLPQEPRDAGGAPACSALLVLSIHVASPDPEPRSSSGGHPEVVPVGAAGQHMGEKGAHPPVLMLLKVVPGIVKSRDFWVRLFPLLFLQFVYSASH